ncbi:MAG: Flp family type IVb pilin [Candidatus Riflebacteria bacterium]|nr:Flp family type IVb pilin [Candidatus Riflebacteria bacterium]
MINRFFREEEGQGLVEYALILGLIAIVAIATLSLAGDQIKNMFNKIGEVLGKTNEKVDKNAANSSI